MTVNGLHHTCYTVSSLDRSVAFYRDALGCEVLALDLADGFDVGDPEAWERVDAVELACLNAGVTVAEPDIRAVSDVAYRRILGANVDGVVFGVRRLAALQQPGSAIVVTASLAGLVAAPQDPLYTLTKHAVVGFVRAVAPQLAGRGIRINAVAPGFVDTPLLGEEARQRFMRTGFPLLQPEDVADAVLAAVRSDTTGQAVALDGIDDYVRIAHNAGLDAFPLTVAVWFKTSTNSGVKGLASKYAPASYNGYQIFFNNGKLCAWYWKDISNYVYDGGSCTMSTAGTTDGRWHQAALVVDSAGGRLYVDGVQKASQAWTGTAGAPTTGQEIQLGHYSSYLPGAIDELRVYSRALGATEVSQLYAAR